MTFVTVYNFYAFSKISLSVLMRICLVCFWRHFGKVPVGVMTTRVLAKDLCEKAFQRLMLRRETFGRGVVLNTAVEFGHVQKTQKTRKLHYVEIYVVKYVRSHMIMY